MRGIYAIIVGEDMYIGGSQDVEVRLQEHIRELRARRHSRRLQRAWEKQGEPELKLRILKEMPGATDEELAAQEMEEIRFLEPSLNTRRHGSQVSPMKKRSARVKASESAKRRTSSPEYREAFKQRMAAPVVRAKVARANRERAQLPEIKARFVEVMRRPGARAKHAETLRGRKLSPEHRAKIQAAMSSPEVRAKLSKAARRPEAIARSVAAMNTPEARAKKSVALRGRTKTPEHRAKIRASLQSTEVKAKLRGRKLSLEHRDAVVAAIHTPEARAKVAQKNRVRMNDNEWRYAHSQKMKALWADPIKRAAMLAARK